MYDNDEGTFEAFIIISIKESAVIDCAKYLCTKHVKGVFIVENALILSSAFFSCVSLLSCTFF